MENQYVGFIIGNSRYCINIMDVKEVVRENKITKLPDSPAFVEGIMNLRGIVIPVISVRKKLNLTDQDEGATDEEKAKARKKKANKLIIVTIEGVLIGFMVDGLDRVFTVDSTQIQTPDRIMDTTIDKSLVEGVVKADETVYVILEIKKLLDVDEKTFIRREIIE